MNIVVVLQNCCSYLNLQYKALAVQYWIHKSNNRRFNRLHFIQRIDYMFGTKLRAPPTVFFFFSAMFLPCSDVFTGHSTRVLTPRTNCVYGVIWFFVTLFKVHASKIIDVRLYLYLKINSAEQQLYLSYRQLDSCPRHVACCVFYALDIFSTLSYSNLWSYFVTFLSDCVYTRQGVEFWTIGLLQWRVSGWQRRID